MMTDHRPTAFRIFPSVLASFCLPRTNNDLPWQGPGYMSTFSFSMTGQKALIWLQAMMTVANLHPHKTPNFFPPASSFFIALLFAEDTPSFSGGILLWQSSKSNASVLAQLSFCLPALKNSRRQHTHTHTHMTTFGSWMRTTQVQRRSCTCSPASAAALGCTRIVPIPDYASGPDLPLFLFFP